MLTAIALPSLDIKTSGCPETQTAIPAEVCLLVVFIPASTLLGRIMTSTELVLQLCVYVHDVIGGAGAANMKEKEVVMEATLPISYSMRLIHSSSWIEGLPTLECGVGELRKE